MRGLLLLCLFGTVLGQEQPDFNWNHPDAVVTDIPEPNACVTDPASCGCCVMKKLVHQMEEKFDLSLDDLEHKVAAAQTALNHIRSDRSAFSVGLSDSRRCIGDDRSASTVIYEVIFLNLGNNYDGATGVYTVSRKGVYSLALTVYSDSGAPNSPLSACAHLQVNGVDVVQLSDTNSEDQEDSATTALVRQLAAGDTVSVYLPAGCVLCDNSNHYNTFSGFLLYAN